MKVCTVQCPTSILFQFLQTSFPIYFFTFIISFVLLTNLFYGFKQLLTSYAPLSFNLFTLIHTY